MTPRYTSYADLRHDLLNQKTTCVAEVEYYLGQIDAHNGNLNAFVEVYREEALARAQELDQARAKTGAALPALHGMVIGIKDVLCYAGHEVTAASKILGGFRSLFTSTAVQRLIDAGAIIIGRLNCDEFAMGSGNENSFYGPVKNAADTTRVPGGSSGGSAVAVQADMCLLSLGTDTGGSVRQPAAFCGVWGLKPTYGRISRYGLLAYASSFDQIGTFSHSAYDAALTLEVMAGADAYDSTASKREVPPYTEALKAQKGPYKVAYLKTALSYESIDPAVRSHTQEAIEQLQAAGNTVEGVDFGLLDYLIPTYYVLSTAEASSNLARYDGIHYGYRSDLDPENEEEPLEQIYLRSRTEGFGKEVKRRIMLGTFVLSAGYYDAYYSKAQKVRRLLSERMKELFERYDFLLLPTTPTPAFPIGQQSDNPVDTYVADIFTVMANLAGVPAVSIPTATTDAGLPIGLQVLAPQFEEAKLLAFSDYLKDQLKQG